MNGARGALLIWKEITSHYVIEDGNRGVYWNHKKTYIASISISTTLYLGALLYSRIECDIEKESIKEIVLN